MEINPCPCSIIIVPPVKNRLFAAKRTFPEFEFFIFVPFAAAISIP